MKIDINVSKKYFLIIEKALKLFFLNNYLKSSQVFWDVRDDINRFLCLKLLEINFKLKNAKIVLISEENMHLFDTFDGWKYSKYLFLSGGVPFYKVCSLNSYQPSKFSKKWTLRVINVPYCILFPFPLRRFTILMMANLREQLWFISYNNQRHIQHSIMLCN